MFVTTRRALIERKPAPQHTTIALLTAVKEMADALRAEGYSNIRYTTDRSSADIEVVVTGEREHDSMENRTDD